MIQWMLAIYVELGRIAFQVYCILLLFCLFILLIFKFDVEAEAPVLWPPDVKS